MYNHQLIEVMTRERERELVFKRRRLALAAEIEGGGEADASLEGRWAPGPIRRSMRHIANLLVCIGFHGSVR